MRLSWRGRARRGQPLWRALAIVVLLPLSAAAAMGSTSVLAAGRSADQALRAQRLVAAVELLDGARRAADAEVLPTMLVGVLADQQHSAELGFTRDRRRVLRATEPGRVVQQRERTDEALAGAAKVPGVPELRPVLAGVRAKLGAVRAVADRDGNLQQVADGYAAIATTLAAAQRRANAQAISSGLSTASVAALQDLDLVLQLSESASRQLAELFASRVLDGPAAEDARREWIATWGTYARLIDEPDRLSSTATRVSWTVFQNSGQVIAFSDLLDRQALNPQEEVLKTGALPGLAASSLGRDLALVVVLQDAVNAVTTSAQADRAEAVAQERLLLWFSLGVLAASLLFAGLVVRWLAGSMRALATGAQNVSRGLLEDVEAHGPRELRLVATALSSAVAGLRRVQQQARAVVAGDPEAALRQEPLPGPLGEVVHASVEQIVEAFRARESLQDELAHQASHDPLTGLANRAQTLRNLSAALAGEHADGPRTGVLFIDLDGFKAVNDSYGHAAGDELLCEVGRRLAGGLRSGDTVGRLGGDEFVVTIRNVAALSTLIEVGHRLISAVSRPVPLEAGGTGQRQASVGASIGIAMSAGASSADALLADADKAAYRAKHLGRGRVEVFDEALRSELAEQADLHVALREALATGELRLHYQPVVNLASRELVGYEALARWTRPGLGSVPPDVFIAVAEASTLVCELDTWVLTEAAAQFARWRAAGRSGFGAGRPEPTIAVNISGRHLADPRVLVDVSAALSAAQLPARLLVVEITETVLAADPRVIMHLQQLRALGIRVAIDDFGTGYTSIGALSTTPADILKIDRSFFTSDDPGRHQLATLITRAAHTFGLRVIAEGIETPEQLARARADGCEEAQGYLFARPLPPEAVEDLSHPLIAPETLSPTAQRSA